MRATAALYLGFLPLQALQLAAVSALWGMQRFKAWNILRLLPSLCWLAALLVAAANDAAPRTASLTYVALYAATVPVAFGLYAAHTSGRFRVRRETAGQLVKYSLPAAAATVPSAVNLRLDQALMAAFLPASTLGLYAVSVSWSGALAPVTSAIAAVLFPRLASTGSGVVTDALGKGLRLAVLISVAGTVALGALTPFALPILFGAPFGQAAPAAIVLVVAAAFAAVNGVLEECLRGLGGVRWPLLGQLAAVPVTIVLLIVLLGPLGLMGAAVASLVAYATTTVVYSIGVTRISGRTVRDLFVPRPEDLRTLFAGVRSSLTWAWPDL